MTTAQSVKVANLRTAGYTDLEKWISDPNNVYVGRVGRIFIHPPGNPKPDPIWFGYKGSKWANPYPVPKYKLEDSLLMYVIYLFKSGLIYDIDELQGKSLGCFCPKQKDRDGKPICHAQILADLLERCYEPVERLIAQRENC